MTSNQKCAVVALCISHVLTFAAAIFFACEAGVAKTELIKEKESHLQTLRENRHLQGENIELQQKYLDSIKAQIKLTERLIQR